MRSKLGRTINERESNDLDLRDINSKTTLTNDPALRNRDCRSILAQCFAAFVSSLSFVLLGIFVTIPAAVIGDLAKTEGPLALTLEQASWYSSLILISQPIGCLGGGFLQTFIGRKWGISLMNTLAILSLIFLNQVSSIFMLNMSSILMGITLGFVEAPGLTYVTEICEPRIRGTLGAFTNFSVSAGSMVTFLLNSITDWRTFSLISLIFPILTLILLFVIPDSPYWLLNKGKDKEALKALCWLRGWVSTEEVKSEFEDMRRYIRTTYHTDGDRCSSGSETGFRLQYLLEPSTLLPFTLLMSYTFFSNAACSFGSKSYYLNIFDSLKLPINSSLLAFVGSCAGLLGNLISTAFIKALGKRFLSLLSMMLSSLVSVAIGMCIWNGGDVAKYTLVGLFTMSTFAWSLGLYSIPWILLGEIYPIKTRSIASGITGASYYVIYSMFTKTYPALQELLQMHFCFTFYGILGIVGFVILYKFLPETEGRTPAEINQMFTRKKNTQVDHS